VGFSGADCATVASLGILKTIVFIVVGVVVVILLVVGGWFLKRRYDAQALAAMTDDIMQGLGMHSTSLLFLSFRAFLVDSACLFVCLFLFFSFSFFFFIFVCLFV
jgi:hypothetical protein